MKVVCRYNLPFRWSDYRLKTTLDVTDVAWSPGDRYLASVGLDSAVIIWCGFTLGIEGTTLFPIRS